MMAYFFAEAGSLVFDPDMLSRTPADALLQAPPGTRIVDDQHCTNHRASRLNGRVDDLDYGSSGRMRHRVCFTGDQEFRRV